MDHLPLANLFKRSNYDEPIASELSALDYLYEVLLETREFENYDDTEPFINEKLFCVSNDLENVTAKCELEMDGEKGILEIKNNKTNEILWSNTWDGAVELTTFSISLDNLKKDDEYAVCFTGTGIKNTIISISFENDYVQEREKPLK